MAYCTDARRDLCAEDGRGTAHFAEMAEGDLKEKKRVSVCRTERNRVKAVGKTRGSLRMRARCEARCDPFADRLGPMESRRNVLQ